MKNYMDVPLSDFQPIDDRVMGGVSRSMATLSENEGLLFTGVVSPENGGGFCSIRSVDLAINASPFTHLCVEALGDGKVYSVRLFSGAHIDNYAYGAKWCPSQNQTEQFRYPLNELIPTWRGREMSNAPPLNTSAISSIGFLIGDRQFGEFSLTITRVWFE